MNLISPSSSYGNPLLYTGLAFFLYYSVNIGESSIGYLFLAYKFSWSSSTIGLFFAYARGCEVFSMLFVPHAVDWWMGKNKVNDITWLLTGYGIK